MKKTVLNATHIAMGAKMVEFGGWHMPVAYSGIREEHKATRTAAGLFDLCHMGRFVVTGDPEARVRLIERSCTNEAADMKAGEARYAVLCDEKGNALDDIIYYVFADRIFVVVNAGNRERDLARFQEIAKAAGLEGKVAIEDRSDALAMLAVQGPKAMEVCKLLTSDPVADLAYYSALEGTFAGEKAIMARTGYTGEDGLEVYFDAAQADRVWKAILEAGKPLGLLPIGLGARDTLRLEAAMPLYGHELTQEVNPLEAGLGFAVKTKKKEEYPGKAALAKARALGPARRLVCIVHEGKKIPREGYVVKKGSEAVGKVTSGTFSPYFEKPISMALVTPAASEVGTDLTVDVRGEALPGKVVKRPFYKRSN